MAIRILNVIRYPIGGIRTYLRYTYSRMNVHEYASTILTVDLPEAQLLPQGMAPLSVELKTVPERQALFRLFWATRQLLQTGAFDLVHSQGSTAALATSACARWYRVPHVVTLHETFQAEQFSGAVGELKRAVM